MSPILWQEAWDAARPRLEAFRQSVSTFPHVAPRVLRVGLLDSELLDQELLQILTEPISKALGLVQSSYRTRFEPELTLFVHLILYKYSVWDSGATYGAKLQNLRYKIPEVSPSSRFTPSGFRQRTLYAHATASILIPYVHSRLRIYALSRAWPDAPSSDTRRKAWEVLTRIETTHSAFSLAGFIVFLCDGRYRTWTDRMLGLRLVPSQSASTRQVSYEFMNRQMVWHAFTEFLLFLLPLVNARILRRRISNVIANASPANYLPSFAKSAFGIPQGSSVDDSKEQGVVRRGRYWALSEEQCAICAENVSFSLADPHQDMYATNTTSMLSPSVPTSTDEYPQYPLHVPYLTSCLHQYCYVCISDRMLRAADDGERGWECLRCESIVTSADRVEGGSAEEGRSDDLDNDGTSLESSDFLTNASE